MKIFAARDQPAQTPIPLSGGGGGGYMPSYHPSMYKPPASYEELMTRANGPPPPPAANRVLPPTNSEFNVVQQPPIHKSPSLAKILRGEASMLSITHVNGPAVAP